MAFTSVRKQLLRNQAASGCDIDSKPTGSVGPPKNMGRQPMPLVSWFVPELRFNLMFSVPTAT
jgi:hypothetical protein